jgi:hypothetical protein
MEFLFDKFVELLMKGQVDLVNSDVRLALLTAAPQRSAVNLVGISEMSGPGYARKELTGKSIVADQDSVRFSSDSPVWDYLSGPQIKGALIYKHTSGDGDALPIGYTERGYPIQISGGRYEIDCEYLLTLASSKASETRDILTNSDTDASKIASLKLLYGV